MADVAEEEIWIEDAAAERAIARAEERLSEEAEQEEPGPSAAERVRNGIGRFRKNRAEQRQEKEEEARTKRAELLRQQQLEARQKAEIARRTAEAARREAEEKQKAYEQQLEAQAKFAASGNGVPEDLILDDQSPDSAHDYSLDLSQQEMLEANLEQETKPEEPAEADLPEEAAEPAARPELPSEPELPAEETPEERAAREEQEAMAAWAERARQAEEARRAADAIWLERRRQEAIAEQEAYARQMEEQRRWLLQTDPAYQQQIYERAHLNNQARILQAQEMYYGEEPEEAPVPVAPARPKPARPAAPKPAAKPVSAAREQRKKQQQKRRLTTVLVAALLLVLIPVLIHLITSHASGDGKGAKVSADITVSAESPAGNEAASSDFVLPEKLSSYTTEAADATFFRNTLFIGDSGALNLQNAGKIDGATYFASQKMKVSDVLNTQVTFAGTGSVSLSELLESNKYNRVFLMLGMNDLSGITAVFRMSWMPSLRPLKRHRSRSKSTSSAICT